VQARAQMLAREMKRRSPWCLNEGVSCKVLYELTVTLIQTWAFHTQC
jgi:hypothetical protein